MGNILKIFTILAISFTLLPAHAKSVEGKRKTSESIHRKGIEWQVTQFKDSDEEVAEITFTRKNKEDDTEKEISFLDDDGILTLTALQHSVMSEFSDQIVDGVESWNILKRQEVESYPRFQSVILKSLNKVKKYDNQAIREFTIELNQLMNQRRIDQEDASRIAELQRLIPVLQLERQHAEYLYKFFESRDEIVAEDMSRTLGKFLMTFAHEHAHEMKVKDGENETVRLFDSTSKNPLAKAVTGRPLWIMGDDIQIREPRTSISINENIFKNGDVVRKAKHKKYRSDDDEIVTEEKPERVAPRKGHEKVIPELDLSDL